MSEDLHENGYEEDSLEQLPSAIELQPTLRDRFWEIGLSLILCMFFVYVLKQVPANGIYLDTLIGLKMKFLHIKISYLTLAWPLRILSLGSFFYGVFVVLEQRMTYYHLNDLNLIYTRGVITHQSDSTDLIDIRDHKLTRTIHDRILGLSRVKVISKDLTDPEMLIKGITAQEGQNLINFLRRYAYQNYTEMRIAQEKQKIRRNRKPLTPKKERERDIDPNIFEDLE